MILPLRPAALYARRPGGLTLLLAAIAALGAVLVLARGATYGAGLHYDSINYVAVARNLLAGEGFTNFSGSDYTLWPPLYPLLLAAASLGIFDPLDVAGPLNAAIFGLTIFVVGQYLRHRLQSPFLALWAGVMIALSIPLAFWASWALSGPAFILLATLALIQTDKYLSTGKLSSLLWAAAFCALAWQTRYIGVAVPVAAGLLMIFQWRASPWERIRHIAIFSLIAAAPMGVWLLRNYLLTGEFTGPRLPVNYSLSEISPDLGGVLMGWVDFSFSLDYWPFVVLAILAAAALIIAWCIFTGKHYENRPRFGSIPFLVFSGFALTYFLLFVIALLLGNVADGVQARFMTPLYLPLLIAVVVMVDWFMAYAGSWKFLSRAGCWLILEHKYVGGIQTGLPALILALILSVWAAGQIVPNVREINQANSGDWYLPTSYSAPPWADSDTIDYIRQNPVFGAVYSNSEILVYLNNKGDAAYNTMPGKFGQGSLEAGLADTPDSPYDIYDGSYIVWFENHYQNQFYDYGAAALRILPNLEPVADFDDGLILKVNRGYKPAVNPYWAAYNAIRSYGQPAANATFDIFRDNDTLVYHKEPCNDEDASPRFFLHLYPPNTDALPQHRRQYDFDNRDFQFPDYGVILEGKCIAIVPLPDYEIARIRTGQFISGAGQLWEAEFRLQP